MATCWSVKHDETVDEIFRPGTSTHATAILPLDDDQPSAAPAATAPYVLDYSLMATILAILIFLWMQ
jgi:hypothetical protein